MNGLTVASASRAPESSGVPSPEHKRRLGARTRQLTIFAGALQLAGLAIVLAKGSLIWPAGVVISCGAALSLCKLAPIASTAFRRHRELWLVVAVVAALAAWVWQAMEWLDGLWSSYYGTQFPSSWYQFNPLVPPAQDFGWPWKVGGVAFLPLAAGLLASAGALVLIADAVRVRVGLAPRQPIPWRDLTVVQERPIDTRSRAVAGVLLVALAAAMAISFTGAFTQGDPTRQIAVLLAVAGASAMIIGIPILVGLRLHQDRDKALSEAEQERRRLAALLHDSVLQTLALVQRNADDPEAVSRLARRQEHALRAWMAGQAELAGATLAGALRETVTSVEDEFGVTIELTALGDRALDGAGEALVAATREALRNAARHAAGAPVVVFAEISPSAAQVFVRDEGPGFEPASVAPERRGIRDAIVGRMAAAGGEAQIDATPGEGTEVALRIGGAGTLHNGSST